MPSHESRSRERGVTGGAGRRAAVEGRSERLTGKTARVRLRRAGRAAFVNAEARVIQSTLGMRHSRELESKMRDQPMITVAPQVESVERGDPVKALV